MRTLHPIRVLWFCACCAALPAAVEAQLGGFLYKLQKLSGPEMLGYAPFVRFGYEPGQRLDSMLVARIGRGLGERPAACMARIQEFARASQREYYTASKVDRARGELQSILRTLNTVNREPGREDREIILATVDSLLCDVQDRLTSLRVEEGARDDFVGLVWRPTLAIGWDIGDPDTDIKMISLQPSPEFRFCCRNAGLPFDIGIESGININYFFDGGIEEFVHLSLPLILNLHPFPSHPSLFLRSIRIGWGAQFFPPFDEDDFVPALPRIEEHWETIINQWPIVSLDIRFSAR
jgi:hypothetical protein